MNCESMEGGKFGFYGVAAGDWLIREIAPAEGFVLSEKILPVTISENKQVIEITIENRWIVGSAETLKLDAEYRKIHWRARCSGFMPIPTETKNLKKALIGISAI